jgi:hypothetical protein
MQEIFTPEAWRSKSAKEQRQFAEMMGVIADSFLDMQMLARADGLSLSQRQGTVVANMMNITFQTRVFQAQRIASSRIAEKFIRQMLDEVNTGASTQASARRALAELGLDEAQAKSTAAWLKKHDGRPPYAELLADTPQAAAYRTAINRFVNETIMSPEAVDKPVWSSSGFGRLAYSIMSFQYAFTRNVLIRTLNQGNAALRSNPDFTIQDRIRLMTPMAGVALLAGATIGAGELRDAIFARNTRKERDPVVQGLLRIDRAGLFGNLSPLVNAFTSAKYEKDPSSLLSGAYAGALLGAVGRMTTQQLPQPIGPNSPRTNNAEWQRNRAFWSAVVAPAAVGTLAMTASAAPAPVRVAAGLAAMGVGAPDASRAFADATAGPRKQRGRTPGSTAR